MVVSSKRIDFSLFADDVKTLINASAKIFPVAYSYVTDNLNPLNYEYVKVIDDVTHKNEIYLWDETNGFDLLGADDLDINWIDIKEKPSVYPPSNHTHIESDITNLDKYNKSEIDSKLSDKSDTGHSHIKTDITDFIHNHIISDITNLQENLDSKASTSDLSIVQTTLNDKASISHSHTIADVNNLQTDLDSKSNTGHIHGESDITNLTTDLANKASVDHNHDGRYYTQSQTDSKLSNKSDIIHNHNSVYAVKSIETTVSDHTTRLNTAEENISNNTSAISAIQTNMANGDAHSNIDILNKLVYSGSQTSVDLKNIENNTTAISGKADSIHNHTKSQITDFPTLATVATSGSYTDLNDTPTIPDISGKADKSYVDQQDATKVDLTTFNGHTSNTTVHVTQTDKNTWNGKETAFTKNTAFNKNYETTATNIKINGTQSVGTLDTIARADHVHPTDTTRATSTHTHGNITNAGAIGSTSGLAVVTGTSGVLTTGTIPVASGGTGATTAAGALTNLGLTATATELNYTDGVTSNIQTQLNAKAASSHVGATGSAHGVVTTSVNGFMSATDKTKLDGIQSGAVTITQGTVQPSVGFWFKEV